MDRGVLRPFDKLRANGVKARLPLLQMSEGLNLCRSTILVRWINRNCFGFYLAAGDGMEEKGRKR